MPMLMPTTYSDDFFGIEHSPDDGGKPRSVSVNSMVYPPIGFFPFAGTGNGDYHGFYWPIGREELPPLVAYSSHDAYALIPEHGDLKSAALCRLAQDEDRKFDYEFGAAVKASGIEVPSLDLDDVVSARDHTKLLKFDPDSPFRHCAVGDLELNAGNLVGAEDHYRRAIASCPEYGAAHFGLGFLLRRLRRQEEASIHLRECLIGPLAFWGGCFWADHILPGGFRQDWARKALLWLQQTREPDKSLVGDPFLKRLDRLTMKTGEVRSGDLELSLKMIDEYLALDRPLEAATMWINVGDRAAMETTSFRERYGLTPVSFGKRLLELFRMAKLERRAALVDDMLSKLRKGNGLYL